MNVTCGRCGTEYDFDDALVSERGTTVRCTRCHFEFRVRPPRAAEPPRAKWVVRRSTGEEYEFLSLSDLQQAIQLRRVQLSDELSRDGVYFRQLTEFEELEAFFEPTLGLRKEQHARAMPPVAAISTVGRTSLRSEAQRNPDPYNSDPHKARSGHVSSLEAALEAAAGEDEITSAYRALGAGFGVDPTAETFGTDTFSGGATAWPEEELPQPFANTPSGPAAALLGNSALGSSVGRAGLPRSTGSLTPNHPRFDAPEPSQPSQPSGASQPGLPAAEPLRSRARRPRVEYASSPPPAVGPVVPAAPWPELTSEAFRPSLAPPSRAGTATRWIAGLVLLGGFSLLAVTAGRTYLKQFRESSPVLAAKDTRAQAFLGSAQERLRSGDLEGAKAEFDKASALVDNDPEVLYGLLQVELAQADMYWLELRLIPGSYPAEAEPTALAQAQKALDERLAKVRAAADALRRVTRGRPEGLLALADAARLTGDVQAARRTLENAGDLGNVPESSYVLALLDAADSNPSWQSVVARLRQAVLRERHLGRAHVALIYALIQAGDVAAAEREYEALLGVQSKDPLVELLRSYLTRFGVAAEGAKKADGKDEGKTSEAAGSGAPPPDNNRAHEPPVTASNYADAMSQAGKARSAGDWSRAGRLYTLALSSNPGSSEAMTGLGETALAQGQLSVAASHFAAALRQDPRSTTALKGLGDARWGQGDRAGALEMYRQLPPGAVHGSVAQRLAEAAEEGKGSNSPTAPKSAAGVSDDRPANPDEATPQAGEVDSP